MSSAVAAAPPSGSTALAALVAKGDELRDQLHAITMVQLTNPGAYDLEEHCRVLGERSKNTATLQALLFPELAGAS